MVDVVDPSVRSRMMSAIRGRDTHPELIVRTYLHRCGLRFRLHSGHLPGRPDLVLPRHKAVVFVHGCFWHRHAGCALATTPATRPEFWQQKFRSNVERDRLKEGQLRESGWRVFIIWGCEVGVPEALDELFFSIVGGVVPSDTVAVCYTAS